MMFICQHREHKLAFRPRDNYRQPAESDTRPLMLHRVIRTSVAFFL